MEKKRLLGSSDSEDEDSFTLYPQRFSSTRGKKYVIEFKQLFKIVRNGNVEEVRKTLKEPNIQLSGADGLTVVHVAAATNNKEVLRLLLEDNRCSELVNRQDKEGVTPLLAAMMTGSYDTLELLCAEGANPCKATRTGKNVLHVAAKSCDSKAAKIVLKYNSSYELINALNENGDTPLIESVYVDSQVMYLLLEAGAKITVQNPESGRTLLHVIVAYNRVEMLKTILQNPQAMDDFADIKDIKDDTALLIAVKLNKLEMVTLLLNRYNNLTGINNSDYETVFHIAIRNDRVDILKVLLNSGCKSCIDYADISNKTPLLYAAEIDRADCLEELIENGADFDLRNPDTGETFIHVIAKHFSHSTLPYVMNITDVSWFFTQMDFKGMTPYMTAISNGNAYFLREALRKKPVDLCDENSDGEPPVYYTAKHGHLNTMLTLLMSPRYYSFISDKKNLEKLEYPEGIVKAEMRGDIYATDVYLLLGEVIEHPLVRWFPPGLLRKTRENQNVFHACALGGNLEGLKFLNDFFNLFAQNILNEMFDRVDDLGNTPLLFAAQCGVASISCVHYFVTLGANIASVNKSGLNVFNAILTYNPEVAESLITSLLDSCVTGKREHYYEDRININLNFSMLCPKDINQMKVVYILFDEMTSNDNTKARRKVLQHPVIQLFLKNKYDILRYYLVLRFIILLTGSITISFFMPIIYIGDEPEKKFDVITPFVKQFIIVLLLFITIIPVFFKIPHIVQNSVWATDAVAFVPFVMMMALLSFGRTFVLAPELTAILILSCWICVMIFLTTLYHTYSFQMAVFFQILSSISKHLLVLSMSMFVFALSFFCLYHDYPQFSSFPTTFIYTFVVLLLGYFPDMPTFDKEYFTSTPITFHFIVESVVLGTFTIIIVIGFINMLIGLAVRSANVAELDGKVYQHHKQAHFLYMFEFWFNNKLYFWLLKKGIFAEKLKRLRDRLKVKVEIGLYDESLKDVVSDSSIRGFRSIVFQKHHTNKKTSAGNLSRPSSFEGALYTWVHRKTNTPTPQSLIRKQTQWEEETSDTSE